MLHQVTGDPQYQDWGWHIFRAFEKFSKVDTGGYTNLNTVLSVSSSPARCFPYLPLFNAFLEIVGHCFVDDLYADMLCSAFAFVQ